MQKIGLDTWEWGGQVLHLISNFKNNLRPKPLISELNWNKPWYFVVDITLLFQYDTANHILSIWFTKSKRQDGHWSRYWIILTFKLKLFPQSTWCVIFACIFWFYALNICCVQRPLYLQGRVMWLSKSTLSIPPQIGTPTSLHNYKLTKIIKNRL